MSPPRDSDTLTRRNLLKAGGAAVSVATIGVAGSGYLDDAPRRIQQISDNPAFQQVWERTDRPVADGVVSRTWTWGPQPISEITSEPYAESPGGTRTVQYFDKARMEINDPDADPDSIWYVTNGLLTVELISGNMQIGDNSFEPRSPAQVNVAGDADDPTGPQYASFGGLLETPAQPAGTTLTERVDRAGNVTDDPALAAEGVTVALVDEVTAHGTAAPFWDFMNSSGPVYEGGQFIDDLLFENAYFATGRPITEAYWAEVLVGGTPRLVLIQCFERRCLTYTPANDPNWQVEMGNIGLHYQSWRYDQDAQPTATFEPTATPTVTFEPTPTVAPTGTSTPAPPGSGPFIAQGLVTLLRVHDVGTGYGPPDDQLDAEVVIQLDSEGPRAFGYQLRVDPNEAAHRGMLDVLRDAFNHDRPVRVDYVTTGPQNGRILRVMREM